MNDVQTISDVLWWLPYAVLPITAFCGYRMGKNVYAAWFLWRHRNTPISDPVIAKALEGVKPPRYWLYALAWALATLYSIYLVHLVTA
ncbi:hypothetical protein ABE562_22255 [Brucella intermedia]|uniref:hypothetical protein n=1 Tax=Brucella intermedia TaxID=94625 RepID=UPI0032088D3F